MRHLLLPLFLLILATVCAEAKPRRCTSAEMQSGLTDNMVLECTRKGGSVKCDTNGTVLCCKNLEGGGAVCVSESNLNLLRNSSPPSSRPPAAKGGGKPPGKIKP